MHKALQRTMALALHKVKFSWGRYEPMNELNEMNASSFNVHASNLANNSVHAQRVQKGPILFAEGFGFFKCWKGCRFLVLFLKLIMDAACWTLHRNCNVLHYEAVGCRLLNFRKFEKQVVQTVQCNPPCGQMDRDGWHGYFGESRAFAFPS